MFRFAKFGKQSWNRNRKFGTGTNWFSKFKEPKEPKLSLPFKTLLTVTGLFAASGLAGRDDIEQEAQFSCSKRKCDVLDWNGLKKLLPSSSIPFNKDILVDTTVGPGADLSYPVVIIGDGICAISALDTLMKDENPPKTLVLGGPTRVRHKGDAWEDLEDRIRDRVGGKIMDSDFIIGLDIKQFDVENKLITLGDGRKVKYGKLLYTKGALLDSLTEDNVERRVITANDLEPLEAIDKEIDEGHIHNIAVIGGGFLGTEAASSLAGSHGKDVNVYQIFSEPAIMWNYLPPYVSSWLEEKTKEVGVKVLPGSTVVNINQRGEKVMLRLADGRSLEVDQALVMPTDVKPSTDLLARAGLPIDPNNGAVAVDEKFSAGKDIFVAGDAASYLTFSGRIRKLDNDFEASSGKVAAENVLGKGIDYKYDPPASFRFQYLPFGGDLVGDVNSNYETAAFFQVADPKHKFERGAIFYLDKDKKLAGAVFMGFHSTEKQRMLKRWMRNQKTIDHWEYLRDALQPVYLRNCQTWHLPASGKMGPTHTEHSDSAPPPVS